MLQKAIIFVAVALLVGSAAAIGSLTANVNLTTADITTTPTTLRPTPLQTTYPTSLDGSLFAQITIGPIQPICVVGNMGSTPPSSFPDIEVVISSSTGQVVSLPVDWVYDGCNVTGSVQTALSPGIYSLDLTSCPFMGCSRSLPVSFTIMSSQSTSLDVSIDTGIR